MPKRLDVYTPDNRLKVLIEMIDKSYPEGFLSRALACKEQGKEDGLGDDGLATFIVNELGDMMHEDTWDACLVEADVALWRAVNQLQAVHRAVETLADKEFEEHNPVK